MVLLLKTININKLIYENFFENLINKKICELELSEKTIYNITNYFVNTNGSYFMFICKKDKMKNYINNFPTLYFSHIDYNYIFELTYKELFMNIDNYYYFMIIFPYDNIYNELSSQSWYMGLPFLRQYQFIFNSNERTIGFYKTKNFVESENQKINDKKSNNIWIYFLQILIIIILVVAGIYIGMQINKQRKKRANELKDDDYDYTEENNNEKNKNKLIN